MTEYNIEHYVTMQKEELEEHRYFMGQRLNRAVGNYELLQDWIRSGHAERFKKAYLEHLDTIESTLEQYGDGNITPNLVHKLLED